MPVQVARPDSALSDRPIAEARIGARAAGVIRDARSRHRRQQTAIAAALALIVAAGAYIGADGVGNGARFGGGGPAGASAPARIERAGVVLVRAPYMGVACGIPNWVGCDRIGLAVWLRRPALAVSANVAGATFNLGDPHWSGPPHHGRRTMFAGFLQPAGLTTRLAVRPLAFTIDRWLGSEPPTPTVSLQIAYSAHDVVLTRVPVTLEAGWG